MTINPILQQIRRKPDPQEIDTVRRVWQAHVRAIYRHDLPALLATLTENCLYEVGNTAQKWHGHAGTRQFYSELWTAFPNLHYEMKNIVIGAQGVYEETHVSGYHQADWQEFIATGQAVEFDALILFPWQTQEQRFGGERLFLCNMRVAR